MAVDTGKVIDWYKSNEGRITYSMGPGTPVNYGPRQTIGHGQGGTTDCSGGIASALMYAGAEPKTPLGSIPPYTTVNIGSLLSGNGYTKVYSGRNTGAAGMWDIKTGDIVNMGAGSIANSIGGNGHVGVMSSPTVFTSVTWNGGTGLNGNAVQNDAVPAYFANIAWALDYFEVWRNTNSSGSGSTPPSSSTPPPSSNTPSTTPKEKKKATGLGRYWRYNDMIFGVGGDGTKSTAKKQSTNTPSTGGTNTPSETPKETPKAEDGTFGHIFKEDYFIIQEYGHSNYAVSSGLYPDNWHSGIDINPISKGNGAPADGVYSPCNGTVIWTGFLGGAAYGYSIMIKTPLGTSIYLGHLSDLKVSDGQEVTKGQQISSGNFQVGGAYHVHYEYLAQGVTSAGGGKNAGNISPVDIIPGGFNNVINTRISV